MSRISLNEFAERLGRILPVMMKEFFRRQVEELCRGVVTLPQFVVMEFLEGKGPAKMRALADFMGVAMPSMTGTIDRLVSQGLATRVADPADRRIIKVALTAKGLALINKFRKRRREMIIGIFGRISQDDREDYLRILAQIKDILTARNGSPAK